LNSELSGSQIVEALRRHIEEPSIAVELTLNIILLVLATAATLVALGKDLSPEGSRPWIKKLTDRTLVALLCLLLALGFGVWKEFLSNSEKKDAGRAAEHDKADLQKRLDTAQQNLHDFRVETEATQRLPTKRMLI
jgi:hypothetical protein